MTPTTPKVLPFRYENSDGGICEACCKSRLLCGCKVNAAGKLVRHLGTHPVTETTCDYHACWCHRAECRSKRVENGERCNCGVIVIRKAPERESGGDEAA